MSTKTNDSVGVMTHKEFMKKWDEYNSVFAMYGNILEEKERRGELFSPDFCRTYGILLKKRLEFFMMCSTYYRNLAERSFWFMKPRVIRRAMEFERMHFDTLYHLMILKMYNRPALRSIGGFKD